MVKSNTKADVTANRYQDERLRRTILEELIKAAGTISPDLHPEDVFELILTKLEAYLPSVASSIWLMENTSTHAETDKDGFSTRLAAYHLLETNGEDESPGNAQVSTELTSRFSQATEDANELVSSYPWITEISASEKPILRKSDSAFEPLGALLSLPSDYSAIGIPLRFTDKSSGIIILVHRLPHQYGEDALTIAAVITEYAPILIENIRLYADAQDIAWSSTALLQLSASIQSIASIDELLETVTSLLPNLLGASACVIYLWDADIEALIPQSSNGFSDEQKARIFAWDILPDAINTFDQLAKSNQPVIFSSATLDDEIASLVFPDYDFTEDLMLLFPLSSQNRLCGAVLFDFSKSSFSIDSSQQEWDEKYTLLHGVTQQTAVAIDNLQLIKSHEEEAYISVALLQVAQAVVSLKQLDEILATVVRITPILAGVKRCIIYLFDPSHLSLIPSQTYGFSKSDLPFLGIDQKVDRFPIVASIIQYNQVCYYPLDTIDTPMNWTNISVDNILQIQNLPLHSEENNSIQVDSEYLRRRERLLIGFPLSVINEVLGVMLIEEEEPAKGLPHYHIRAKRIELVRGITQQAAIAIKNERLQQEALKTVQMERELQLAREIQTAFIPDTLPELPCWNMDARWEPARQVGGDFYDILHLGENKIGFVIADVADKGMPAALLMTLIRTLIRAAAHEMASPAKVLSEVNELLIPDTKNSMFVTVFYAIIDLIGGKVTYANAGHNPPIIKLHGSERLIELEPTGIALGIFNNIELKTGEITLHNKDWILFYTDGVTESFSTNDEMYSKQRLLDLVLQKEFSSARELVEAIYRSVTDFCSGQDLSDDLTLAALFRN